MPGIHPIVGIDADGASIHQPAFAAAAAGPSADKAVVEGAVMLARTVVALAETPAERDRVLRAQGGAGARMSIQRLRPSAWLAAHYDDLVAWRRHIHPHPELGRQEFATTQFVASHLADAGLNPKVLPGGTGLTCDFGPEHGPRVALRADMDALPMAERTGAPYASVVPGRRARLRPRRAHVGAAGRGAGAGVGARTARRRAADLPARRGADARRRHRRDRRGRAERGVADLRAALRSAAGGRQGGRDGRARSPRRPIRSRSRCTRRAATPRGRI